MADVAFTQDTVENINGVSYIRIRNFYLVQVGDIISHPALSHGEFYGNGIFSVINPTFCGKDYDGKHHHPDFDGAKWVVVKTEWVHEYAPKFNVDFHWYNVRCKRLKEDGTFDMDGQVLVFLQSPDRTCINGVNCPDTHGKMELPEKAYLYWTDK